MEHKQVILENILNSLSIEELRSYILQNASKYEKFVDNFISNFSREIEKHRYEEHLAKIKNAITEPFKCYNKKGVYSEEMSIAGMLEKCHIEINVFLEEKNYTDAIRELIAIVEVIGELYENYDDLEGIIANECQKAINLLMDIFKNEEKCPKQIKIEAHRKIDILAKNSNYEDFDLGDLDSVLLLLSIQLSSVDEGLRILDSKIEGSEGWKKSFYIFSKIDLLHESGMFAELEKIVDDYIAIPEVRKYKLGKLIDSAELDKVVELLLEGIKLAENEHSRKLEIEWKDLLLDVYIEQNNKIKIKELAEDLFYNGYDPRRYFPVLKKYTPHEEWDTTIKRLVNSLKEPERYGGINNIKAWIYINEKMWNPLWDLVNKGDLETMFKYENFLKQHFGEKLLVALTIKLKEYVAKSSETKHYLFAANILTNMRLYPKGNKVVNDLIFEFYMKYADKKEFVNILQGI